MEIGNVAGGLPAFQGLGFYPGFNNQMPRRNDHRTQSHGLGILNALIQKIGYQTKQNRLHHGVKVHFKVGQPTLTNALSCQRNRRVMSGLIVLEQ